MQITYVGNEGFLIKASGRRILIDGLFGGFESDWCDVPSAALIRKMEKATDPFDQIGLILISHAHVDHFNSQIVSAHLESNPEAILVCPRQVVQELQKDDRYQQFASRVRQVTPDCEMPRHVVSAQGITIGVWRLMHSPYYEESNETPRRQNKHENVQNLGFTITIAHKTVFHGGDWEGDHTGQEVNPLQVEKIDLAFLSPGACLRLYGPDSRMMSQHQKPKHIVLMHLYPPGNLEGLTEEEKDAISGTTVFTAPMESMYFL